MLGGPYRSLPGYQGTWTYPRRHPYQLGIMFHISHFLCNFPFYLWFPVVEILIPFPFVTNIFQGKLLLKYWNYNISLLSIAFYNFPVMHDPSCPVVFKSIYIFSCLTFFSEDLSIFLTI